MSHWHQKMVDGAAFWISCQHLNFLNSLICWQRIQNSAPFTIFLESMRHPHKNKINLLGYSTDMVIVQVEISSRKILTRRIWEIQEVCWKAVKVRQSRNDIFQAKVSSKKRTNEFYFTTMKPQVDLFLFVFGGNWRHQTDISKLTDL